MGKRKIRKSSKYSSLHRQEIAAKQNAAAGSSQDQLKQRWFFLAIAVLAMLVSGIIYAWSILKAPFISEFGWSGSQLALNYTLLMSFFCIGIISAGFLVKRFSPRTILTVAAFMVSIGFFITSRLQGQSVFMLYLGYAVFCGTGIGSAYNTIITTVGAWFPDRKGVASGTMMVGFGFSTLILGNIAGKLFNVPIFGWRNTYLMLAIVSFIVLIISSRILKMPAADIKFPPAKAANKVLKQEDITPLEISTSQMLRRKTFWKMYLYVVLLHTLGMTVLGFAKDLFITLGSTAELAVSLVGIVSVCNGLIRIVIGWMLDNLGRRFSMIFANIISIASPIFVLTGIIQGSLPLGIIGACLAGASYGCMPPIEVVLMRSFYGERDFASNFGIIATCIIPASIMPTVSNALISSSGSYVSTFLFLLGFTVISLYFAVTIRRP